jgi:hypothetical protein
MRPPLTVAIVIVGAVAVGVTADDRKPAFDAAFEATRARFESAFERAEVVFVGSITEVGKAPAGVAGNKVSQTVDYEVVEALKGKPEGKTRRIEHVHSIDATDDRPASPFSKECALRGDWFAKGKRIIVFEGKESQSETALPATRANEAAIRALAKGR